MKLTVLLVLGVAAMVVASPESVLNLDLDDLHHDMSIDSVEDNTVTGQYSWTSPDGDEHFVRYIADKNGYRVLDSNAVPITIDGLRANGEQGAFTSDERDDFFDDRD